MKYFSMFTGVGGFELGIQRAHEISRQETDTKHISTESDMQNFESSGRGGKCYVCVGFSEIDKFSCQLLALKWPEVHNYGDATKINAEELPDFELLVGGFPCQAFSVAGKRRGFEDTRGTLFFDIARIIKAKQPRLFVLENVKGLLNHDGGNTFTKILQAIDELGYDAEWQVLNSKHFGVPQNRERVFIVGHLRGTPRPEVFPLGTGDEEDSGFVSSTAVDANYGKGIDSHGARTAIMQTNNPVHSNNRLYSEDGISPCLNTAQGGNRQPKIQRAPLRFLQRNQKKIAGDYSFTVDSSNTGGVSVGSHIRRLTPLECERLQGFPDGWSEGFSDTQRYKMMGNAVTVNVVKAVMERLL